MSDGDDSLSDSSSTSGGDTDELIAASQKKKPIAVKKAAPPKKRLQKKSAKKPSSIPDADNDSDDDDDAGLFDSEDDSDDSDDEPPAPKQQQQQPKKSRALKKSAAPSKPLSKRERMEALQAKKRGESGGGGGTNDSSSSKRKGGRDGEKKSGYDSADSYDSAEYVRTKEDDDFIDFDDEDEEAQREYNAEQHFDDERPLGEDSDDPSSSKKRASKASKKRKTPSRLDGIDLTDMTNPVNQALSRMKKKKKEVKNTAELESTASEFLREMERAADEDDRAIKERKPATKKLRMLPRVVDMMTQRVMTKVLLEHDLLGVVKRWIQPLPNGTLGNVTLRQKLVDAIAKIGTGEDGVSMHDLKQSDFGKLIMALYMHKKETPPMKRKLKGLIEEYSREVFGKSGNMKDLQHAQSVQRNDVGLAGISRAQAAADAQAATYHRNEASRRKAKKKDLGSIISKGTKAAASSGKSRVSVPYSKGFRFTVRPANKSGDVSDRKNRAIREGRQDLHKRIVDRSRQGNSKSGGNLSIEGRATKN